MNIEELARRVERLEDVQAITQLKARYCAACDRDYDADAIAGLFAPDGVWDAGNVFGRYEGREAIRAHFASSTGRVSLARHQVMNPDIVVDPDGVHASGEWLLFQPCSVVGQGAAWLAATYHDRYVKLSEPPSPSAWLFQSTTIEFAFFAPYGAGWAEERFLGGRTP